MAIAVSFHLDMEESLMRLMVQLCLTLHCLCLYRILEASTDFDFLDYLLIGSAEKGAGMYNLR